jgi:uncharacterized protein YacL
MRSFGLTLIDQNAVPHVNADNVTLKIFLNDIFALLGAICFLIIVISGLRYILARGNADSITKAKNSIIYALVGLVIAILASSIVNVILNKAA